MDTKEFSAIRKKCILEAKKKIRESVDYDNYIIQAVSLIDELDRIINQLITRLRDWYELYNPEFSKSLKANEKFLELILKKDKKELLKEINVDESMGRDLDKKDLAPVLDLATHAISLVKLRDTNKSYLEGLLKTYCPNAMEVLGAPLLGKFIAHSGSLRKLAITRAPVIQIMGAEKSLFKHMKNKGKCPKYGILYAHPLIGKVKRSNQGKMARAIADKVAIALKLDYFKGAFSGNKLRQELKKKADLLAL